MADLFPQSADDQTIVIPPGTHVGHIVLTRKRCKFVGTPGASIIQLDNSYNTGIRCTVLAETVETEGITWDCRNLVTPAVVYEINANIPLWTSTDDTILGHRKGNNAVYNRGVFRGNDLVIVGSGGGLYHYTGATEITIRGATIIGGQFGFVNVAPAGIDLRDVSGVFDYWATPTYEACTVVAFGESYVDVVDHVDADRSLYDVLRALTPLGTFTADEVSPIVAGARAWDRVEVADGRWTQVLGVRPDGVLRLDTWRAAQSWYPISTPTGTATLFRVSLGRYLGETQANRLSIKTNLGEPGYAHWRGVEGGLTQPELVAGSRLDIVRHGLGGASAQRDVDTGFIHVTDTAVDAQLRRIRSRGGFSDQVSVRGLRTLVYDARVRLGQDMGFTVDGAVGPQELDLCVSDASGFNGFVLVNGPSVVRASFANENGTHGEGTGCAVYPEAFNSQVDVEGYNNRDALVSAPWLAHAQHACTLARVAASRRL